MADAVGGLHLRRLNTPSLLPAHHPMPSARPFSCAPKKKAEKEGRRSDAAGAAFPRIAPVVGAEASALRALRDSRGASAGRNRAEKPLPLTPNRRHRQGRGASPLALENSTGILKQLPCALRRTHQDENSCVDRLVTSRLLRLSPPFLSGKGAGGIGHASRCLAEQFGLAEQPWE